MFFYTSTNGSKKYVSWYLFRVWDLQSEAFRWLEAAFRFILSAYSVNPHLSNKKTLNANMVPTSLNICPKLDPGATFHHWFLSSLNFIRGNRRNHNFFMPPWSAVFWSNEWTIVCCLPASIEIRKDSRRLAYRGWWYWLCGGHAA